MHEIPHRMVVDLQAAPGKFGNEPAQGEVGILDPLRQPNRMFTRNRLRLVTAHLPWGDAAGLIEPLHPADRRADRDPKLLGCPIAGHTAFNSRHHPLPKIERVIPSLID